MSNLLPSHLDDLNAELAAVREHAAHCETCRSQPVSAWPVECREWHGDHLTLARRHLGGLALWLEDQLSAVRAAG